MRLLEGTSGFAYKPWKGPFYPEKLPDKEMLRYYAERLPTVEINNTFYRMPTSKMLENWHAQVPEGFRFVLKASRRITHNGRIQAETVADSVAFLFDTAQALQDKLGPVLFQLPPHLRLDAARLEGFLALLPEGRRAVVEFRHASWHDESVYAALRARNVALCISDGKLKDGSERPFVATADWGYLRLRGEEYSDAALAEQARRVQDQGWSEVFVFFKHEEDGAGPRLAARFRKAFEG